jgi:Rad3-related DNA helicase
MPGSACAMCSPWAGEEFSYIYQHTPDESVFKILCKDASRFLHERLQGFHSVVAMSATLTPFAFYQDVLGFPAERTFTAEFPSPFPAGQPQDHGHPRDLHHLPRARA